MRRLLAVLFALVLVAPAVAPAAATVPDARLAVSDLTVAPATPTVGEPVTVTATVRNSGGSNSAVNLTEVRLVNRDGGTVLATTEGPGALSPGDTLAVDLTRAFTTAGTKELAVVAVGEDADNETVTVRRPLTVVVEQADPLVEFERTDPVAGAETNLSVTVSNPNTEAYRNLVVTLDAPGTGVERRTLASLAGGADATLNFTYTAPAGDTTLAARVEYVTNTGIERAGEYAETVGVAPLREDVGVAVSPAADDAGGEAAAGGIQGLLGGGAAPTGGDTLRSQGTDEGSGAPDALAVEVTNFGNAPIRDAVVVPTTEDRRLPRVAVGTLAPGESTTVEVSLAALRGPANVTATVEYATAGRTGTAAGSYDYRPPAGEIRLTGVNLSLVDGRLVVTGNAGNVGDGEVTGVVVRLLAAEGVEPAYPSRDYFVGTVEGSEFAPFELTARVDAANATSVPVEVTYRAGGEERSRVVSLPVEGVEPREEPETTGANAAVAGALVLALATVAGGAVFVARRER
ncbi:CARDB domain-containing protein [Halosegnis marinus]|uniref:CARDB domain-containing protein n=1 Tax=Halosegnis marinus TaxID=3034023 RepID=A0ABD5ZMH3_9EURY|nr:CARDB domain-containing protein [Halosegnis sp. DT85]